MFDLSKSGKQNMATLRNRLGTVVHAEGRTTGVNRLREEIDEEIEQNDKELNRLKNEMKEFRTAYQEGAEVDEQYMECFPTYNDDDYQMSVKDNLGKRPPNIGKSFSHRR